MARFHDVTVVTRANNKQVIEMALASHAGLKPRFIYYDLPNWLITLKRRGLPLPIYYALWQLGVRRIMGERLSEFDLIHHVTFNSFRQPGFWWRCGKPVVLGPIGGGQICPWSFVVRFGSRLVPEVTRSLSVMASRWLPNLHASFAAATVILAANADTTRRIPARYRHKVRSLLETGMPRDSVRAPLERPEDDQVRVAWISRLEKIKGCTLALTAFAAAVKQEKSLRLTFVGGGPEEATVRSKAEDLGVNEFITWVGPVSKAEVPSLLARHDLFLFTSLRDTSGNVLLEAMAAGLPAVTLLHHGAAEIATDTTAIRVCVRGPKATVAGIATALVRLARSLELRRQLGRAAAERIVDVFVWDRKGEELDRVYRAAVSSAGS
jgi:glycosyltransferase involved in cell wall biosynthesis